ncbi:MAG: GspH/FimT family pseudopilin [Chthoniobacteraceae bacterium]
MRGFTLIELILVMALLTIIMAISAPILSRSLRQRGVDQEATRFLALLEYGRSEAVSQGVPMIVWIAPRTSEFGVQVKTGFSGDETRMRKYTLPAGMTVNAEPSLVVNGLVQVAEFSPDGWPLVGAAERILFSDASGSSMALTHTTDRWSWELTRTEG